MKKLINKTYVRLSLFVDSLEGQNLSQKQLSKVFKKICKPWQEGKISEMELNDLCDRVVNYYKSTVRYY